jgi:hypothetical protein
MTDQEFKDFLVYQDALTVKKINEHNASAAAARFGMTPSTFRHLALLPGGRRSNGAWRKSFA